MEQGDAFPAFVNEIFTKGYYFDGLDYHIFHNVLYNLESFKSNNKRVLLAKAIVVLPPEKKPLYDKLKITGDTASYEFGPSLIKGPDKCDIEAVITFDELVAAAWSKQICFGLNAADIKQKINNRFKGLAEIARSMAAVPGEDARLEYLTKVDKDLTPVVDAKTGRVDLKHNKCTFPQMLDLAQNKIAHKINATEGVAGYYLNGKLAPPKAGRELDLKRLVGEGTKVVIEGEMEYLVADRTGYIIVNPQNGKISVTLEVQNHFPIGPETGSLDIKANQFSQFGDVLKGYAVNCNNIRVEEGNVNGEIISLRGRIGVKGNVSNGRLIAQDGIIKVEGIVTMNAYLESMKGDIVLAVAENSTLIGKNITVQFCSNCVLVGETIKIGTSKSNKIIGLSIFIENSEVASKRGESTEIIIPMPELRDKRTRIIGNILEEKKAKHAEMEKAIKELKESKILLAYLGAVKAGDGPFINATRWQATPIINELNKLSKRQGERQEEINSIEGDLKALQKEHNENLRRIKELQQCTIEKTLQENVSLKLYGGLDWPSSFEQVGAENEVSTEGFMALIESLTKELGSYARASFTKLLTEPGRYDYYELMELFKHAVVVDPSQPRLGSAGSLEQKENRVSVISEEDFKYFLKERKWLPRKQGTEVTVDGIFKGYIYDFSASEMSLLLEKAQKWKPDFEKGETIKLFAHIFGNEFKHDLIVTHIKEEPYYIRVGGYFINIHRDDMNKLSKIKNRFEVLLKSC